MFKLAPSLMCADFLRLEHSLRELERAGVEYFHIDVMDGHFVPNLALSFEFVRQVQAATRIPLDVHLMVENPNAYVDTIRTLAIPYVSFHLESSRSPIRLARALRAAGSGVGLALNPSTPADLLQYVLPELDFVLVMTVEPGFAGQKFIPGMLAKIARVRGMMEEMGLEKPIEVDGNLNAETSSQAISQGASILVGGTSSIFHGGDDLYAACTGFRQEVERLCAENARGK